MQEIKEKFQQREHYYLKPVWKKKNKKPPMNNCQVLTWVSHSEKNRYIDFFFPLWFLINLTNKTKADFNGDFIDPVLFCPH